MILSELKFEKLSKRHQPLIDVFCCVEKDDTLVEYKSSHRKRIVGHSKDIEDFLKYEALDEQNNGYSVTHMLIDNTKSWPFYFL